ncbi:hypothetical protein MNBD_GAMMA03-1928 [hydrothermal vent metagenome]|uniref:Membrane transport protein MMPL domain-containing protein n=1 Tax=hydrothermal vent metagenome TaxID=652676 RepID=A0A3B0X104_9ZZZZ
MKNQIKPSFKKSVYTPIISVFTCIFIWFFLTSLFTKEPFQNDLTQFFPDQKSLSAQYLKQNLKQNLSLQKNSSWLMLAVERNELSIPVQSNNIQINLQTLPDVIQILNGSEGFKSPLQPLSTPVLYPYRYLLASFNLSPPYLTEHLQQRWQEYQLGLVLDKQWLLEDPTYHWGAYLKQWQPSQQLTKQEGVWLSDPSIFKSQTSHKNPHLLLLIETTNNTDVLSTIENMLNQSLGQSHYYLSGASWIAFKAEAEIKQTVNKISALAIGMVFLSLFLAFRSIKLTLLCSIPLIAAFMVGTLSTITLFGHIQILTLALGAILFGVAIDYPIHTISAFQSRNKQVIHKIWPTIRLGALTSALGFLMLWLVNIEGLQQIAIFTATGLVTSLWVTQTLKPLFSKIFNIKEQSTSEPEEEEEVEVEVEAETKHAYFKVWMTLFLPGAILVIFILTFKPLIWQDDIVSLSPVSNTLIETDKQLRHHFQQQEVGKKILITAPSIEALLQIEEKLIPSLNQLKESKVIQQYQMLSQVLPSLQLQKQRQLNLPTRKQLNEALTLATLKNDFKPKHFNSFIQGIEKTRQLPLLDFPKLLSAEQASPTTIQQYVTPINNQFVGIIRLSGVSSDNDIESFIQQHAELNLTYFNQRALVASQIHEVRNQLMGILGIFIVTLLLSLGFKFRNIKEVSIILMPVVLSIGATLACFALLETPLSIFHLMSLMLIVAIGLDYSLLFTQGKQQKTHSNEWYKSIQIAFLTTLGSFSILAFSQLALLQAIGLTVLIGILWVYGLSYLSARLAQKRTEEIR